MKNTFARTISTTALAIFTMVAFAQISIFAQDAAADPSSDEQRQEESALSRRNARLLEGSWNTVVTRLDCNTGAALGTFPAMFTFSRGNTFWEAGSNTAPSLRSPSHGVWYYEGGLHYETAFQFFRFNPDGTLAGRQIVRQDINLSRDANNYTATAAAQDLDVNGNVIRNNCSSEVGTRFE